MALRSAASLAAAAPRGLLRLFSTSSFLPFTPPQTNDTPPAREMAPPSDQLFVSGLNKRTTTETLKEAFSQFGEVVHAKVVTDRVSGYSKGFGFVKFASIDEAAKGIKGLDGKFLEGWVIFAEYSRPKQPPTPSGSNMTPGYGSSQGPVYRSNTAPGYGSSQCPVYRSNTAPGYGSSQGPVFRSNTTAYGSTVGYGNTTVPGNGYSNASPGYARPPHSSNLGPANWNTDSSPAYGNTDNSTAYTGDASPTYGNTNTKPAYPSNTSPPHSSYGGPSYGNSTGAGYGSNTNSVYGNASTHGQENNSPFYGSSTDPAYGNTSDPAYGNVVAH